VKEIANEILLNVRERPGDLKRRVEEALARSSEIDPGTMTVDLVAGRIVLRGAARTWGEREEAERLAWAAPGVVAVENELVVRLPDVVEA
jgi:osmotically-inducible protein OsmY